MANAARLGVVLGIDTTEFQQGLELATKKLEAFKETAIEFLSVAAFVEATKKAMEYSNQIVEAAKANEVSTASVLELSKALEENGGRADDASKLYAGLTKSIESAAQGNAKTQESFARVGVSLRDLGTLSEEQIKGKVIKNLAEMSNAAERNGLAQMLLGKAARNVDWKGLSETLAEVKGSMDKYAGAVEQAHELSLKLEASSRQMSLSFTGAVIPALNTVYDEFTKGKTASEYFFESLTGLSALGAAVLAGLKELVMQLVDGIKDAAIALNDLSKVALGFFSDLANEPTKIAENFSARWKQVSEDGKKAIEDAKKNHQDYLDFLQKLRDNYNRKGSEGNDAAAVSKVIEAQAKQLAAAQAIGDAYARHASLNYQILVQQEMSTELSKKEKAVQDAINKVIDDRQKQLDQIDQKIAQTKGQQGADKIIAELERQRQAVIETGDVFIKKTKEEVQATQEAQNTFEYGWKKAFDQYKEDANNSAKMAQDMFAAVTNAMSSAIDTFVKTGKLSFKDFAKSVIADLIAIQLKASAMKMFSSVGGLVSGGLDALMNGGVNSSAYYANNDLLSSATGGPLNTGQASIVGENGPELFVPRTSGTIIPNSGDLSGALGGPQTVFNGPYIASMSAIDTQSALQFISSNKMAIWSANQSANKSMPASR